MVTLRLYSKPGCHLCDEMKTVVRRVLDGRTDVELSEIDISNQPLLLTRYEPEIPVLELDGKKIAKYRISEEQLRRVLALKR
jgi:hypothetical protein